MIRREGTDVTVVAYMGMMYRALEAAEELAKDGISVEIVDPRTLRPMDTETHPRLGPEDPPRRGGRGRRRASPGMGSEIAAFITEEAFDDLDAPVERVTGANAPMPYARNLERLKTPSKAQDRRGHPQGLHANGTMAITKVVMPKLSEAMETGKVIKWLKKEGDRDQGRRHHRRDRDRQGRHRDGGLRRGVLRKILVAGRRTRSGGRR